MSDLVPLQGRCTAGDPDPSERIMVNFGGAEFWTGRRTYAHLVWTQEQLDRVHPGARIRVLQSSYHEGYAPSAGTHDGDGVLDVEITGWDDWAAEQRFLRDHGWADWWRHTGSWSATSAWHHHMISIGCPGPVGIFVPGQLVDYYAGAQGLKGQHNSGSDPTYHPANIDSTIFDYPAWVREQEDDMPWSDWTPAEQDKAARAIAAAAAPLIVKQLLAAFVDDGKTSVKAALRKAAGVPQLLRKIGAGLSPRVEIPADED